MPSAAQTLANAIDHHRVGRLEDAEKLYRRILKRAPRHPDALHLLGLVEHQRGHHAPALRLVDRALRLAPATPFYLNTLGEVHRAQGDLDAAAAAFSAAIRAQGDYVEAHYNLGQLERNRGDLEAALASYERAVFYDPTFASAHNALGVTLRLLGDAVGAIDAFARAVQLDPTHADAHFNLAVGHVLFDEHGPALAHFKAAMQLRPEASAQYLPGLVQGLRRTRFLAYDAWYADLLVDLFTTDAFEHRGLISVALTLLEHDPVVLAGLTGTIDCVALATRPLLVAVLRAEIITDLGFEAFVSRLRASLVSMTPDAACLDLFGAVAEQMFLSDYAAAGDAAPALVFDEDVLTTSWRVLSVASHRALLHAAGAEVLESTPREAWPGAVARVIRRTYDEPKSELEQLACIEVLTSIDDDTSRDVRAQYETHPYPRWIHLPRFVPEPLGASLEREMPGRVFDFPERPQVLVAGVGTGRHPLARALAHPEVELLGIDLSKRSLAYAQRMAESFGVANVRLGQADLLELKPHSKFHLIEAVGVLHHLADPMRGWRALAALLEPGGAMKIGLYSERARASVVAARTWVIEQGFAPTTEGLRAFRARVASGEDVPEAVLGVTRFRDFFSLGELRDLVFHVMEHRTTPLEIAATLEACGLEFGGFVFADDSVTSAFDAAFPGRRDDLAAWEAFEIEHPDTFRSMYQFYCTRPSR